MNKNWKRWIALGLTISCLGSAAVMAEGVQTKSYIVHADSYQLPYKGNEKAFNHHINPGYGSALALKDIKADGTIEFYAITDRGPNGDIPTYVKNGKKVSGKFFPTPENGNIVEKFAPGAGLPSILASRVPNRGSEGLTIDERGHIFALIQSPLNVDGKTAKTSKYTRIVELDPVTKETKMYAYPVDTGYKNTGAAKLGDITSIGHGQFLMIEQGKQHGVMQNLIYKVDLNGATPVANNGDLEYGRLDGKLVPAKKELVLDLRANGWNIEKAEGLALLPDRRTIAVVNDNDFGMDIAVQDAKAPSADISDYIYDSDKKVMIYNKDKSVHKVKLSLKKNAPSEQESQIWFFTLPKHCKTIDCTHP